MPSAFAVGILRNRKWPGLAAYIVMAYIVMALYSYGLYSYGIAAYAGMA